MSDWRELVLVVAGLAAYADVPEPAGCPLSRSLLFSVVPLRLQAAAWVRVKGESGRCNNQRRAW